MPTQQLPAELGGYTVYTGVVDVRASGTIQDDLTQALKPVTVRIYDIGANQGKLLSQGTLNIGTIRSRMMLSHADHVTLQTNDIVTMGMSGSDAFVYNHTTGIWGTSAAERLAVSKLIPAQVGKSVLVAIVCTVCPIAIPYFI